MYRKEIALPIYHLILYIRLDWGMEYREIVEHAKRYIEVRSCLTAYPAVPPQISDY